MDENRNSLPPFYTNWAIFPKGGKMQFTEKAKKSSEKENRG